MAVWSAIPVSPAENLSRTSVLIRNNVNVRGSGSETVVFCHSFGTDQNAWSEQAGFVQHTSRVVLFDHTGATEANARYFSPRRYKTLYAFATDLIEVLEALDLPPCTVVGHSMGGMAALLASLLSPARISKIVLVSTSPCFLNVGTYNGGFEREELDAMCDQASDTYQRWIHSFAPFIMGHPHRPELARYLVRSMRNVHPDVAPVVLRLALQSDHRFEMAHVTTPVHILQTSHDPAVPVTVGEYMADRIPGASLSLLRAEGHLPHISAPDQVNAALRSILKID